MANEFEVKRDGFFGVSFARFVIEKKNIYLVMCMYGCGGYLGTLNYYFFDC